VIWRPRSDSQARNQGGGWSPTKKNFRPPWKNLLDIVKKNWAPLRKLFYPLVYQPGYGPGDSAPGKLRPLAPPRYAPADSNLQANVACRRTTLQKSVSYADIHSWYADLYIFVWWACICKVSAYPEEQRVPLVKYVKYKR